MTAKERMEKLEAAKQVVLDAGLYLVPEAQYESLAEVAADAYKDYPLHNWFSGGKYDPIASKLIMEITLKAMKKEAVIYADSKELNGFAVCLPPGFTGSKTIPFLKNGGMRLIIHAGPGIIKRLLAYETYAMKLKKKFTDNQDWYLYNFSVLQQEQGKGIITKLLTPMLGFFDSENSVAYLETNKEANVGLYRRFSFELLKQEKIRGSEVIHYAMVRKPAE